MSEENVELVRQMFGAAGRAMNLGALDELYRLLDPDVEWIPINAALEGTRYRGHDGVRQWIEDMNRDWDFFEARTVEIRDLGDDRLLALGTWRARGRSSGVELDSQPAAWLLQLRGGKAVRMQTFTDRAKALEAAGLSE
ncbi:MAG: nuclear transport factor 2 family protein [Actinomycetota bacterium]